MIPSQYLDLCIQLNGVCRWSGDEDDDEKRQNEKRKSRKSKNHLEGVGAEK